MGQGRRRGRSTSGSPAPPSSAPTARSATPDASPRTSPPEALLEAELQVKNERLARANAELSRKNKELDEFTYVVSHDLQEPLRTLIAFSDFLMRDQGDRLDDAGREYVRYLVEASRRLRALIQDLLTLSRAGKVTGEFARGRPGRGRRGRSGPTSPS